MSQENNITLGKLAQIALGGNSFGKLNISLLHTIINLALKKLDCENEKVTISGIPAEHIQKMLEESSIGPALIFDEKNVKTPMKQFEKIEKLEDQVEIVERSLENHISGVDESCQTVCEVEEQKDEVIERLLKNEFLTRQMKEQLSLPIICRLNRAQISIDKFARNMKRFKKECLAIYENMDKVEDLHISMVDVRQLIELRLSNFNGTMTEIQQKMDTKVNNCDIIPLKRKIKDQIDRISEEIKVLHDYAKKPRACLSVVEPLSQRNKISFQMDSQELNIKEAKNVILLKRQQCECDGTMSIYQITLPERIVRISTEDVENALLENAVRLSFDSNQGKVI